MYVTAPSKPEYSLPETIERVEVVLGHRRPDVRVPALELGAQRPRGLHSFDERGDRVVAAASGRRARARSARCRRSGSRSRSRRRASTSWSIARLVVVGDLGPRRVVDQLLRVGVERDPLRGGDGLALVDERR